MREEKTTSKILVIGVFIAFLVGLVHSQCGNGIIDPGETCDTGPYVGYYYNNTCCSKNCTYRNGTGAIYTEITCTGNGNCNDGNGATTDRCVTVSGFGVCNVTPTGTQTPCPAACTVSPCYSSRCVGNQCRYTAINGSLNGNWTAIHCLNETKCWGGYQCFNGAQVASVPTISRRTTIPGTARLSCETNYSWSSILTPQISGGSSAFPVTLTVRIDDEGQSQGVVLTNCMYTFYTSANVSTGVKVGDYGPYFWWGRPFRQPTNTNYLSNRCKVRVNITNECNPSETYSHTTTFSMNPPIFNKICPAFLNCNDFNGATLDSCRFGNDWCYHFPYDPFQSCGSDTGCLTFPCFKASCDRGVCMYTGTNSTNVTAGKFDGTKTCYNDSACFYDPVCDPVVNNVIFSLPEGFSGVTSTTFSTYYNTSLLFPARNFLLPASPYIFNQSVVYGHPGFIYTLTPLGACATTPIISGNGTSNLTLSFSGTWNDAFPKRCNFTVTGRTKCDDATVTSGIVRFLLTACGDGILQSGEQCDLGTLNGLSTQCCTSGCQFTTGGTVCRNDTDVCDAPETCTGASSNCPVDGFKPASYQCNTSSTPCTVNVTCTGLGPTCPSNFVTLNGGCNSDNNLCTFETCDASHNCVFQYNVSYNDGFYCNGVEGCNATSGFIIPGTPIVCNDNSSCTTDSCNDALDACVYTPLVNSTGTCGFNNVGACVLGNLSCDGSGPSPNITCIGAVLSSTEICLPAGVDENCNGVVDENCNTTLCFYDSNCTNITVGLCQVAVCDTINHVCVIHNKTDGTICNDGLTCTYNETCSGGYCLGLPVICNDNNPCTQDTCTEPLAICVYDGAAYVGIPCDDTNACTYDDACNNQGQCLGGLTIACPPTNNQCTDNVCNVLTGNCSIVNLTGACDDGLACTTNHQCINGVCQGSLRDCNDFIPCTTDVCVEPSGNCQNNLQPGTCYINGACYTDGTPDPNNPCHVCNSTLATTSFVFTQNTNTICNDNNLCTTLDRCNYTSQSCAGIPTDCSGFTDQCNTGECNALTGTCVAVPFPMGTPCSTGLFCVQNQVCSAGLCGGGTVRNCSAFSSQCAIGQCNETIDSCYAAPLLDYTPCVLDSLICNGQEWCIAGNCAFSNSITCPPPTQCSYYQCIEPTGCTQFFNGGQPCDDGNNCTVGDFCSNTSDICSIGPFSLDCDDLNDCTNDFCNPVNGCYHVPISGCESCVVNSDCTPQICRDVYCTPTLSCNYTHQALGTPCSDGDVCNGLETCNAGTCVSGNPLVCNDNNPCTNDTCISNTGCYFINSPSNIYNDNDPCTINDRCAANGTAISDPYNCPASDQCAEYLCCNISGIATCMPLAINIGQPCDLDNPCSGPDCLTHCMDTDTCTPFGTCEGTFVDCGLPGVCELSVACIDNMCVIEYATNNTTCQTANLCTEDYCDGFGNCIEGPIVVDCPTLDSCHGPGTCVPSTGLCSYPTLPDGSTCNDGNPCTLNDTCVSALCIGSNPKHCSPINQCHAQGFCNISSGLCINPMLPDFSPCVSGNACFLTSVCITGECTVFNPIDCSSTNPCLTTSCNNLTGCVAIENSNPCDDGDVCTNGTYCFNGQCASGTGTRINCDDSDPCTIDMCSSISGCFHSTIPGCVSCQVSSDCPNIPCQSATCLPNNTCTYSPNDQNVLGCLDSIFCNGEEYCSSGSCQMGTPPNCDDLNECTIDSCNYTLNSCQNLVNLHIRPFCTSDDLCATVSRCDINGQCIPQGFTVCSPAPPCQFLEGCNPGTGLCEYAPMPDFSSCNDNNMCTTVDQCINASCVGSGYITCTPIDQCHSAGVCDVMTGLCPNIPHLDGTLCDDGLFCTPASSCLFGICQSINAPTCPFSLEINDPQCQAPICFEFDQSCGIADFPDGTPCVLDIPQDVCSGVDECVRGRCSRSYAEGQVCRPNSGTGCDVPEVCIYGQDSCPPDGFQDNGVSCNSGFYCYLGECAGGLCRPETPRDCSSIDTKCNQGVCNETLQSCQLAPKPDNTPCVSGVISDCIAYDACLAGACSHFYAHSSVLCDTGSLCFNGSHCSGTSMECITGTPRDCTSFNGPCAYGTCNSNTGQCYAQPIPCTTCIGGCTYDRWPLLINQPGFVWPVHEYLCGSPWEIWMQQDLNQNEWFALAKQFISSQLNQLIAGACTTTKITAASLQAVLLLEKCDYLQPLVSQDLEYRNLTEILKLYNEGVYGPGMCNTTLPFPARPQFNPYPFIAILGVFLLLLLIFCCFDFLPQRDRKGPKNQ